MKKPRDKRKRNVESLGRALGRSYGVDPGTCLKKPKRPKPRAG